MSTARELRDELARRFPGNFEMDVATCGSVVLSVVDDSFRDMSPEGRYRLLADLMRPFGFTPAIIEAYTSDEAREAGVVMNVHKQAPATWADAIEMIGDGKIVPPLDRGHPFKRVVFYSYKGGVGRTTALIHAGFHLARNGKRVALVDMDVEAPGLHRLLPRTDGVETHLGLVDYLWERQVKPSEDVGGKLTTALVSAGSTDKTGIAYAVEDPVTRAQVYVVPAGSASRDYVQRLGTLSYRDVCSRSDDAWSQFEQELKDQLDPEIVLVDARTGLGEWGGLSLLRLADEACIVMFPSEQNVEGVAFVRSLLAEAVGLQSHLIFSPVPEGPVGQELSSRIAPLLALAEDEAPVQVFYSQGIAGATALPVESAMPAYSALAKETLILPCGRSTT